MKLRLCRIFIAVIACFCCNLAAAAPEYEVKAAFIYNFARFIQWPPKQQSPDEDMYLCLVGGDPFREALDVLLNKKIRGRQLKIRKLEDSGKHADCDIIYISPSLSGNYQVLLETLATEEGVLTVSDINGFAANGGIIELYLEGTKVRFAINVQAAERAGLELSSQLLRLARIVE